MKKTTMQDIAASLGVSRTTVWKVFSGQNGVSDSLRETVLAKARELNYKVPSSALEVKRTVDSLLPPSNIALAVCRPETSIFWMAIIHQIAKELSFQNTNLLYTYLPSEISDDYQLPASLQAGTVHGIIVINVYHEKLLRLLAASPLPKVFLDTAARIPFSALKGDLVMMENRASISCIMEKLIAQGKRSFGFIGDINYALSNYQRFMGFAQTLKNHGLPIVPELNMTGSIGADTYREEIDAFLDTLPAMPEAFICASDYVACLLIPLLTRRGLQIPQDVAVSGFDGNTESPLAEGLTTVQVFNQDIGTRLAAQIQYRIQHPRNRFEVITIASEVVFQASTGGAEDAKA